VIFPVSGVETPFWVPPLVAFAISFFTSMAGLSGAVLLLPFQFSILGYTTPSVTPTNLVFNIIGIPSGVYKYFKEGRLNWPLAIIITIGSLPGIFLGAILRVIYLPDPSSFRLFAGTFLLYTGSRMFFQIGRDKGNAGGTKLEESLRHRALERTIQPKSSSRNVLRTAAFSFWRTEYEYCGQRFAFNNMGLMALSLAVGLLGGIYGIGGAAMIAPFILTFFGLPIHTVAGATLISALATSAAGVLFFEFVGPVIASSPDLKVAPDWALGATFGAGGMFGMYLGASAQKHVPAAIIRLALAILICAVGANYVLFCG
jgi:uncharacterized membrane protein YfcA